MQALTASAGELARMMQVIETEILPKTREGVAAGNKVGEGKVCVMLWHAGVLPRLCWIGGADMLKHAWAGIWRGGSWAAALT